MAIRLTEYSHGAGCGCKISPEVLSKILGKAKQTNDFPQLLVGNDTRDDAAVYEIEGGKVIISTTDFFMPIVDDPADFGGIASVNAISDVYAMGGKPLMAIAILGWPINQLPPELANEVMNGAREACARAGIPLAGGHSIDAPEPIFGLAVTGIADKTQLKANSTATVGCELFLTKPLGVGILSTAQKKGLLREKDRKVARDQMLMLNSVGAEFSQLNAVKAMTDVTGFGLLGHLVEMAEGSGLTAEITANLVPIIKSLPYYIELKTFPGGTTRNFSSYGDKIGPITDEQKAVLCDPQTSGGLLVAVDPNGKDEFLQVALNQGFTLESFGIMRESGEHIVTIN